MNKKLYVGNLPYETNNDTLKALFEHGTGAETTIEGLGEGSVAKAMVIMDRVSGKSRGFGFVELTSSEDKDEEKAIDLFNNLTVGTRQLKVNRATEDRGAGGSGGGNRGGDRRGGGGYRGGSSGGYQGGGNRNSGRNYNSSYPKD